MIQYYILLYVYVFMVWRFGCATCYLVGTKYILHAEFNYVLCYYSIYMYRVNEKRAAGC